MAPWTHNCGRNRHVRAPSANPAQDQCLTCQGDVVAIPVPKGEEIEAMLAHPETQMKWVGSTLTCVNPHFHPLIATFTRVKF